jgi:exodeoxyribonuclease-3
VLTGDFNTLAPGERFEVRGLPMRLRAIVWMTGRNIRWRTIQMILSAGYVDGYRTLHPEGDAFTFPTWDPHIRLDYTFLPAGAVQRLKRCDVIRDAEGVREASDHFPLLSEITDAAEHARLRAIKP